MQTGLPLIGEEDVAVCREHQIVDALEALRQDRFQKGCDGPGIRVEKHQSALVVGNENAPVPVDLQSVWPAVIFGDLIPFTIRRDAEDAAERYVGDVEASFPIERRTFQKGIDLLPRSVRIAP